MIQEGLNIPNQETSMNILPELSDGLNVLLDQLVKSSFVIEKQPPQVFVKGFSEGILFSFTSKLQGKPTNFFSILFFSILFLRF